ncbi:ABC transporter ATP-binding protein [uncultured Amnibacterium sp.]|uniref:ABC transporter ATP-binding protein n=1 Tax=uncultured Amnibacterium sp. TaxID=1631851 RepID=UPI0035CB42C9
MAVLEIEGLSKRFGKLTVADDLHLSVQEGEVVGVVGPNGAGKSTFFAMIAGEIRPDAGRIRAAGTDITHLRPSRRARLGIGRTFQVPRPFEGMTVYENVLVCAQEGAGLAPAEARPRAIEVLEQSGLVAQANERAGSLTLLQRKRLEVARAWATGPRIILLDEVAGGLTDPEVDELVLLVRDIAASGVAVIWIEHVVRALTATVSRLLCLAGGHFVAEGTPQEVLANREVRDLYLGTGADTEAEEEQP